MSVLAALVVALLASAGAGLCAFADGALLSIDPDEPPSDPALAALVRRRDRAHRALAFARVALQMGAGAAFAVAVYDVQGFAILPLLLIVLGGLALVVLSETTARDAGDRAGVVGLDRTRVFIEATERGLIPVVLLGEWVDASLAAALPASAPTDDDLEASVEKFRHVVAAEADVGTRGTSLLTGVFALGDTTVADVMTPRIDIVGIKASATWDEVVTRVRTSEHARLVVHGDDLDEVVGILYAKDLLPFVAGRTQPEGGWRSLVRTAAFIPVTKRVDAQLRDFRAHRRHIAVVADEFGGTAGIVTIEDLLELIVGEIQDEHDREEPEFSPREGGQFLVAGRMSLDLLSDAVGDDLRHDDVTTVGGLVYELFGRVPRAGESVEYKSWRLVVERVRGRRVERVVFARDGAAVSARPGP